MKKGVARKLRENEIEFQKRCFKRRAKSKVTIRGDKASPRLYWDRGKRSSRDIIIMWRGHREERDLELNEEERSDQHGGAIGHWRMSGIVGEVWTVNSPQSHIVRVYDAGHGKSGVFHSAEWHDGDWSSDGIREAWLWFFIWERNGN
ncbi:hypothetical protein TNCV_3616691 [Trichonephila clavipes]|nr:hypothetical protein TNCV_3616691 [Trichonephila clavipes]